MSNFIYGAVALEVNPNYLFRALLEFWYVGLVLYEIINWMWHSLCLESLKVKVTVDSTKASEFNPF